MLNHLNHLNDIKGAGSKKAKEEYLKALSESETKTFKLLGDLCYGVGYNFGITKDSLPEVTLVESSSETTLYDALSFIKEQSLGGGFGSEDKRDPLIKMLNGMSSDDQEVILRVFRGNLGCGLSSGTINKVWPNTIFVPPYMRCDILNKKRLAKLKPPYYIQTKLDGKFVNVVVDLDKGSVGFYSRDWNDCTDRYLTPKHIEIVERMKRDGFSGGHVFHGEIRVIDENGDILPREDGNGYLNRDEIDPELVVFHFWDSVTIGDFFNHACDTPYSERLKNTASILDLSYFKESNFLTVKTKLANSVEDVKNLMREALKNGDEGIVLKNPNGVWKHGTSTDQLKGKIAVDCDLKVVGYELSTETKYAGMIASIIVESSCKKLRCNVGGGLSDEQRSDIELFDRYVAEEKIVKVRYNDVVENEQRPNIKSLYLQRVVEFRDDKTEADSLEKILYQLTTFEIEL